MFYSFQVRAMGVNSPNIVTLILFLLIKFFTVFFLTCGKVPRMIPKPNCAWFLCLLSVTLPLSRKGVYQTVVHRTHFTCLYGIIGLTSFITTAIHGTYYRCFTEVYVTHYQHLPTRDMQRRNTPAVVQYGCNTGHSLPNIVYIYCLTLFIGVIAPEYSVLIRKGEMLHTCCILAFPTCV